MSASTFSLAGRVGLLRAGLAPRGGRIGGDRKGGQADRAGGDHNAAADNGDEGASRRHGGLHWFKAEPVIWFNLELSKPFCVKSRTGACRAMEWSNGSWGRTGRRSRGD